MQHLINLFLKEYIPADSKILEVGCNVGNQLRFLQEMGYYNLYGIEEVDYRGTSNIRWKVDYCSIFSNKLLVVKNRQLTYVRDDKEIDTVFLLEKHIGDVRFDH